MRKDQDEVSSDLARMRTGAVGMPTLVPDCEKPELTGGTVRNLSANNPRHVGDANERHTSNACWASANLSPGKNVLLRLFTG